MSDLDDEELEATRRLNGVAKMSDIEKDIKRCEQLIKPEHANWIGISNQLAIAHIVDRVKEVENDLTTVYLKGYADAEEKYKTKIKDLQSKLEEANKQLDLDYVDKNYIPVEKVKEIVKEAIEIIESEQFKVIMGDMTKVGRLRWLLEEELLEGK